MHRKEVRFDLDVDPNGQPRAVHIVTTRLMAVRPTTAQKYPGADAMLQKKKKKRKRKRGTPVFYAILVPAHLYFSRCASERERSERERCASSRVPFAIS